MSAANAPVDVTWCGFHIHTNRSFVLKFLLATFMGPFQSLSGQRLRAMVAERSALKRVVKGQ